VTVFSPLVTAALETYEPGAFFGTGTTVTLKKKIISFCVGQIYICIKGNFPEIFTSTGK